jgi:flagellar basal body rod protein FlgG
MSSSAMQVAMTGLNAQQARIQVISNNLANVNTTSNASFAKALWVAALKNAPQSISLAAPRKLARFVIIVSIPV